MKSVGKQLQEARQARNWTPELAARETKIKVNRLRDLEADDYTHFSSPTYARGFVRTYARALGLDEYKILRQLDTKLPEDETSSFGADSGIPYVPEPSKTPGAADANNTGLYIVLSLGLVVMLVISYILFETYRIGELPAYFTENPASDQASPPAAPATAGGETPAAQAKPVDTNTAPPSVTASGADTNAAPRALPVDANTLNPTAAAATDTNTPVGSMRALPVDPNALNPTAAATDTNTPVGAVRALPVDPNTLNPAAAATDTNTPVGAVRALPVNPSQLTNSTPADGAAAVAPRALPVDPRDLAGATNDPPPMGVSGAMARQSNSGPVHLPPAGAAAESSAEKRLVLTASRDSFVRVTSQDGTDAEKVLYASMLHTGQSVGFDGRKFSINVGDPSAVDITLDGVNYGPHSDQEAPETFTVESHQP